MQHSDSICQHTVTRQIYLASSPLLLWEPEPLPSYSTENKKNFTLDYTKQMERKPQPYKSTTYNSCDQYLKIFMGLRHVKITIIHITKPVICMMYDLKHRINTSRVWIIDTYLYDYIIEFITF